MALALGMQPVAGESQSCSTELMVIDAACAPINVKTLLFVDRRYHSIEVFNRIEHDTEQSSHEIQLDVC